MGGCQSRGPRRFINEFSKTWTSRSPRGSRPHTSGEVSPRSSVLFLLAPLPTPLPAQNPRSTPDLVDPDRLVAYSLPLARSPDRRGETLLPRTGRGPRGFAGRGEGGLRRGTLLPCPSPRPSNGGTPLSQRLGSVDSGVLLQVPAVPTWTLPPPPLVGHGEGSVHGETRSHWLSPRLTPCPN